MNGNFIKICLKFAFFAAAFCSSWPVAARQESLPQSSNSSLNFDVLKKIYYDEKKKAEVRAKILEKFDGVEPSSYDHFRPLADELFKKAVDFVKRSDDAGVLPENFEDYVLDYLKETSSGPHRLVSKNEFCKFCSSGPNVVRLYLNLGAPCLFEPRTLTSTYSKEFLDGIFFSRDPLSISDSKYHHAVTFSGPSVAPIQYAVKQSGNDTKINFASWPAVNGQVDVAIDFSKVKTIETSELDSILEVLYYDRPEIYGLDRLEYIDLVDLATKYGNTAEKNFSSRRQLYDEALKKTFGCGYDECLKRVSPNFDKLPLAERAREVNKFNVFVSVLGCKYMKFSEELQKQYKNCKQDHYYYTNKLFAVLSDSALCARLLGFQAITHFDDDQCNELNSCTVVDPGCVVVCSELAEIDEKLTLKQAYEKITDGDWAFY